MGFSFAIFELCIFWMDFERGKVMNNNIWPFLLFVWVTDLLGFWVVIFDDNVWVMDFGDGTWWWNFWCCKFFVGFRWFWFYSDGLMVSGFCYLLVLQWWLDSCFDGFTVMVFVMFFDDFVGLWFCDVFDGYVDFWFLWYFAGFIFFSHLMVLSPFVQIVSSFFYKTMVSLLSE